MKKWLLVLVLLPLAAMAQLSTKPAQKGFVIEGKLDGFPDGTEILLYKNGDNVEMAKAKLLKTKFTIKGTLTEPTLCFLIVGTEKPVEIYIENAIISVKAKKAQPPVFEVEGSASHKDFSLFIKTFMPLAKQVSSLASTINTTMPGAERDKLLTTYNVVQADLQKAIDQFIKDKPRSIVSPFILNATYTFNEDIVMLENRFNLLMRK